MTPYTPIRTFRIDEHLWQKAQARAAERGETVSDAVRRFLEEYTSDDNQRPPTPRQNH